MHATPMHLEKSVETSHHNHAFRQLEQLLKSLSYSGVNLWAETDEGETVFHIEHGTKHVTGTQLEWAILRAVGKMPSRSCQNCGKEREINCFVRRSKSEDGFGNLCNICNRLKSRASHALYNVSERAL
jgi:hypothetical protein